MSSVRRKLFLQVLAVIAFIVGALWLSNTFLLQPYYMRTKKDQLIRARGTIDSYGISDYYEKVDALIQMGNELNAIIVIFDSSGAQVYTTHNISQEIGIPRPELDMRRVLPIRKPLDTIYNERIDPYTEIELGHDRVSDQRFLTLKSLLRNDFTLFMSIPVSSIESSIAVVNNFLFFVGILSAAFALVIALIISRAFTGAILQMNRVTRKMKTLDFSERCAVRSKDEFGQLAESINEMSESLDEALRELGKKNESLKSEIEHRIVVEEMRKQFITNVSHELKTPLALIQGYAEGLELNVATSKEKRSFYSRVIREESARMNMLVKDLLDLAMLETGNFDLHRSDFYIDELLEKVINKFERVISEKDIDLEFKETDRILVLADAFRTEQILTNYISNAIFHVNEKKRIRISIDTCKNHVVIRIFNSGAPIPEEEKEKIWTSFYRIDRARTRDDGRYGIGLSIVKAICDLDGTQCGFSNLSDGVEFTFSLSKSNR